MDEIEMRRELQRRLSDPEWRAQQEVRYRSIMGTSEISFRRPPARFRQETPIVGAPLPPDEAPGTIEELWLSNWQRSSGALTITRFPDDTVVLDFPDGTRTLFMSCPAPRDRFSWLSETSGGSSRSIETYRCPDRFEALDEALLEMHRTALAMFTEIASAPDD